MAADDIYKIDIFLEAPSGEASFGLYYEEAVGRDGTSNDTQTIADAWDAAHGSNLLDCLSADWKFASIIARKMVLNPVELAQIDNAVQPGTIAGVSLPANNAILLGLKQATFTSKSDGRVFIPGVAETVTSAGVLTAAFLTGALKTFTDALILQLAQLSAGTGRWDLGVISAKVRDAAPPAKDWEAAFAPVTSISRNPIVATQRRRQTKVRGRSV